jgi:Ca2+-binding EF-hand superfamily protein
MVKQPKTSELKPETPGGGVSDSSKKISKIETQECGSISDDIFNKIFKVVKMDNEEFVNKNAFMKQIAQNGIFNDDPRIKSLIRNLEEIDEDKLTREQFIQCIKANISIV